MCLDWQPSGVRDDAQPTEPQWPRLNMPILFIAFFYFSSYWMKPNSKIHSDPIAFKWFYLTGDGVGARTCLTGEGECLIGDGDCCRANCALAEMDGGVGDLDFGLGGILGGVLCGSCCPVAPSMTISTVAIDLASKWASIFCKRQKQSPC